MLPDMWGIMLSDTKDRECKVPLRGMSRSGEDRIARSCNPTCPRIMATPACWPGTAVPGWHPPQ